MADNENVRRIALSLPETTFGVNDSGQLFVDVTGKGIAWSWLERVEPKKPRVPRPDVLAVRVAGSGDKDELLASDESKSSTEPHRNGFPAVLVLLAVVDRPELTELLTDAWRSKAPKKLVGSPACSPNICGCFLAVCRRAPS